MLGVALDRHDVNRVRFVRVNVDRESEVAWQVTADFAPGVPGIVAPHYVPMFLHEQRVWPLRMHCDVMNAVADFRLRIGNVLRMQTLVDWLPTFAAFVGAERPRSRDGDEHSLRIFR